LDFTVQPYGGKLVIEFKQDNNKHSADWFRWFNELPVLMLITVMQRQSSTGIALAFSCAFITTPAQATVYNITAILDGSDGFGASSFHDGSGLCCGRFLQLSVSFPTWH
jgi:hypothetical protein